MSENFPFFAIAKKFGVEYATVLQIEKMLRQGYGCSGFKLRNAIKYASDIGTAPPSIYCRN